MLPGLQSDDRFTVVVAPELTEMPGVLALIRAEVDELRAAIGVPVSVATTDPGVGPRWQMAISSAANARLQWLPNEKLLKSSAPDNQRLFGTFSLLHTVVRTPGNPASDAPLHGLEDVIDRVRTEVAGSFPLLRERGFDWENICSRHAADVLLSEDPLAALQRWLARLADVHTWVYPDVRYRHPPYAVRAEGVDATFLRVPAGTAAHRAGVRPGWRLTGESVPTWCARSGAPTHAAALIAGRRLLALSGGEPRQFRASSPGGRFVEWIEPITDQLPPASWTKVSSACGYLRIATWQNSAASDAAIETALGELEGCARLIVDLRGNAGGNLVQAIRTRDRFLREPTVLGTIRYSTGDGRLDHPRTLHSRPLEDGKRWAGEVVVLTDALTCSASEDFLLGLHGLSHVRTAGERSCGGSGRPRRLPLLPGMALTISTALTYDRTGRCIEGSGIPVDVVAGAFGGDTVADDPLVELVAR